MATEKEVYDALVGKGFDMTQAAGIMGNIQNESSYNQEAVGDGGTSFGLVQWHVPGYPFAPGLVTGNLAVDLKNQMDRIVQASHGVNMGGDAAAVAGAWASQFEKCVGCQPGGPQYVQRQQNADRIFQQAKTGHWPTGPGNPGGPTPQGPGVTAGVSAPGLLQQSGSIWSIPFNFFESTANQVTGLVTATEDIAQAAAGISNAITIFNSLIQGFAWFFVPSHIIRIMAFVIGAPITGLGIWNLSRTGKSYSMDVPGFGSVPASGGNLAPVVGITEIMMGSVLLFIAFHNLPADVNDLPSLITYIQGNVAQPKGGGPTPQ